MAKRSSKMKRTVATIEPLEPVIRKIRGQRVILDSDLARIYGVTTARLNQQVNRNLAKFPSDFMFRLTRDEFNSLMLQFATSKRGRGGARKLPYAFTEHGAVMAANVLNSERAVAMSVYVVRAFVKLREVLAGTEELAKKLDDLERKLTGRLDTHEKAIIELFARIRKLLQPRPPQTEPKGRRIGF
jgi:ORF6N domain